VGNVIADWALIAVVVALVIGVFFAIGTIIDECLEYWRAWRDAGSSS
jgi:hypothetical protein